MSTRRVWPLEARLLAPLRVLWGAGCAAVSLLAVVRASTGFLYNVALRVTEWGHLLAVVSLVPLLVPGWRRTRLGQVGAALGALAALLSASSILRALPVAADLPERLSRAFGPSYPRSMPDAPARSSPFVLTDIVAGVKSPTCAQSTVEFAQRDGQPLRMEVYRALGAQGSAPGVMVIHGGAWSGGSRTDNAPLNRYLAARGYVVASIEYRLAPGHPYPAAIEDARAALVYLEEHASELGMDPQRIILLGRSAGGQIALLTAYTANDAAVKGVVAFYPAADVLYEYEHPAAPAVQDTHGILEAYLGGTPTSARGAYEAASAVNAVGPNTPPTLLIHGERDEIVPAEESARLDAALAKAGRPHLYLRLPWATHVFDLNLDGPGGQISTYAVERFLGAVAGSP